MSDLNERPNIIGVFGGNHVNDEVLVLARQVAHTLIAARVVVLTGAVPPPVPSQVKGAVLEVALTGARWIGIHNCSSAEGSEPSGVRQGLGLVLHPRMGEQRNFLEALLCDAAVVLPGDSGAISEAVSMLCLRKPVLLGGTHEDWEARDCGSLHDLFSDGQIGTEAASDMIKRSRGPLGSTGPLARMIHEQMNPDQLSVLPANCALMPSAAEGVASWVSSVSPVGSYPEIAGHAAASREYDAWLASIPRIR